jgi:hypothetical protein
MYYLSHDVRPESGCAAGVGNYDRGLDIRPEL